MKCTKNIYVHVQPRFCCHCQPFCCAGIFFWKFPNFPPPLKKKWSTLLTWNKMLYTSMTYYFLGFAKIVMRNNAIEIIVCFIEKLFIDFKAWYGKRSNLQFTLSECTQCRPMVLDSYLLAHILDLQC